MRLRAVELHGRDRDERLLRRALRGDVRLICLSGPPGVGKSALAAACVPESSLWLDLAPRPMTTGAVIDRWITEASRQTTTPPVVLDGLDHDDAAEVVRGLRSVDSDLRVLVTRRAPLGVQGALEIGVAPLAVPRRVSQVLPHQEADPCVQCFVDAARLVHPGFEVSAANAESILRIAEASGGLPLALQLLAAWIGLVDVGDLAEQCKRPSELLRNPRFDMPRHQRDLVRVLHVSLERLSPEARRIADVVALFRGAATLQEIQSVLGEQVPLAVLGELADGNLVQTAHSDRTRVSMLPIVRECLRSFVPVTVDREAYERWFVDLVDEHAPAIGGPATADAVLELAPHVDVLGPLVEGCSDASVLARLALGLVQYFTITGQHERCLEHLRRARHMCSEADHDVLWLDLAIAASLRNSGEIEAGTTLASAIFRNEQHTPAARDCAAVELITIARVSGISIDQALTDALENATSDARGTEGCNWPIRRRIQRLRSQVHAVRADVLALGGRLSEAMDEYERARSAAFASNHLDEVAWCQFSLAGIHRQRGDRDAEERSLRNAIETSQRLGVPTIVHGYSLASLALVLSGGGHLAEARELAVESLAIVEALGMPFDLTQTCRIVGLVMAEVGDVASSRALLRRSMSLASMMSSRTQLAELLGAIAVAAPPVGPSADLRRALVNAAEAVVPDVLQPAFGPWLARSEAIERRSGSVRFEDAVVSARDVIAPEPHMSARDQTVGLSARESEILALVAQHLSDREIADHLTIGLRTVHTHVSAILRKLGVSNRREAATWANSSSPE